LLERNGTRLSHVQGYLALSNVWVSANTVFAQHHEHQRNPPQVNMYIAIKGSNPPQASSPACPSSPVARPRRLGIAFPVPSSFPVPLAGGRLLPGLHRRFRVPCSLRLNRLRRSPELRQHCHNGNNSWERSIL
jgi:hypothetical protein